MKATLLTGARLLDPASGLDRMGELLAIDGEIAALGETVPRAGLPAERVEVDCDGACLAPGFVDLRAHLGEPGFEHKERIETAAAAAAAGGITSLVCLPNSDPPADDEATLGFLDRRARKAKGVKIYPCAAVTKGLAGELLAEMALLKEAGAVAFTDGARAIADSAVMMRALSWAKALDAIVIQHPEDPALARGGAMNSGPTAERLGLAGIPAVAEAIMVARDVRLVALTGARYHVAHVSTADAIDVVRRAKARGLPVTCETTPHHLALNELDVEGYRTFAKTSPPLRSEADRRAVIEGLRDGSIDAIASDHCPQDQDNKRLPFDQAEFGVVGLETLFAVTMKLVHEEGFALLDALAFLTHRPADAFRLEAGRLRVGARADLALFDPERPWKVRESELHSLSKNTAFEGRLLQGRVLRTMVDGRTVFDANAQR